MNLKHNEERDIFRGPGDDMGSTFVPLPLASATPDSAIAAPKTAVSGTFTSPIPQSSIQTAVTKNGFAVACTRSFATSDNMTYTITFHITSGAAAGDTVRVAVSASIPGKHFEGSCNSGVV